MASDLAQDGERAEVNVSANKPLPVEHFLIRQVFSQIRREQLTERSQIELLVQTMADYREEVIRRAVHHTKEYKSEPPAG